MTSVHLSEGRTVSVEEEAITCVEYLFEPAILGRNDLNGLSKALQQCYWKSDLDVRAEVCRSVVIAGNCCLPLTRMIELSNLFLHLRRFLSIPEYDLTRRVGVERCSHD